MNKFSILGLLLISACTTPKAAGLDANGDAIPLAIYTVSGGNLSGEVPPSHKAQWNRFNTLIPASYHTEIVSFQPIDSVATDGIDGTVAPLNDERSQWLLMLDVTGETEAHELDRTMVHEYAHLLSLRLSQVPLGGSEASCATLYVSEGCPLNSSYLAKFGAEFWTTNTGDEEVDYVEGDFVTEYAASNAIEDLAESFAEYVVHTERWTGNSVADRKVQFFAQFPELVRLRSVIRTNL
ncbi:putative zinc-binding metallopeptidase [Falsihalocynthiibacter arcticus]|uniref:Uncharacterized protein n=1 Tax=Falsihalocynthiibacter arcticus TaxID=1579316 RepID=A0A126UYB5_9RHOB|nr:putative zinc-binding metallopeptidase [Falsihalocynthiibacter arcticus]AML51051.1 hypothetical protein RC74_06970 [Falsihalocynthiibacter arcticus]